MPFSIIVTGTRVSLVAAVRAGWSTWTPAPPEGHESPTFAPPRTTCSDPDGAKCISREAKVGTNPNETGPLLSCCVR